MSDDDSDLWIQPLATAPLAGDEPIRGTDATVLDFWRFAMSDLRMNNARGYLAEFLVARALGLHDVGRIEWDAYDLLLDGSIKIEVKSSAYLQAWEQKQLSRISFSSLRGTRYDPRHGDDPAGRQFNAHVYVFCVQTATDHAEFRPLDVAQWEFYVVPVSALRDGNVGASLGLSTLRSLATAQTDYYELRDAIVAAASGQAVNDAPWWTDDLE